MKRRTAVAAIAMLAATGAHAQAPLIGAAKASTPRRIAELFAATLSAHEIDAFAALFAETYRNYQLSAAAPPLPRGVTDKQGTKAFFQARLMGIPNLKVAIESIVAEDDHVAASFVYTGNHEGTLMGVAPTGKHLRFSSCDIFAVRDGLITEHWGMGDSAGVLAQLRS